MISGDVLKYRKGFLIPKRYETHLASSKFPLTTPGPVLFFWEGTRRRVADADVQAEEGQAKEGAWELFPG